MILVIIAGLLAGCASYGVSVLDESVLHDDAYVLDVGFFEEDDGMCAAAALSAALDYYGIDYAGIESIYDESIDGTRIVSMVNYANRYIRAEHARLNFDSYKQILMDRGPFVLLRTYADKPGHFYVVKGFMKDGRALVVNDGMEQNMRLDADPDAVDISVVFFPQGVSARAKSAALMTETGGI